MPASNAASADDAASQEIARLRALVGPDEKHYLQLKMDVLGGRDHAIGQEAATVQLRAEIAAQRAEIARLQASILQAQSWHLRSQELDAVYASNTWRIGHKMLAPLRVVRRLTGCTP